MKMADSSTSAAQNANGTGVPECDQKNNPGPIVHVRADSDSTMNEMFAVVENPRIHTQLSIPLRMRNLPPSFFNPPSSGSKSPSCHSRENSVDSTLRDTFSPCGKPVGSPQPHHNRSQSAPVELQHNMVPQQHTNQHLHLRQPSYDVAASLNNVGPFPPGWEPAMTEKGQLYYMNHITKSTQWEDPRTQVQQQVARDRQQQHQQQQLLQRNGSSPLPGTTAQTLQCNNAQQQQQALANMALRDQQLGPLPQDWETSVTQEGEVYFINHAEKTTQWFDPRLPIQNQTVPIRQRPPPAAASQHAAQQQPPSQQQPQGVTAEQKRQQMIRLQRLENERRVLQQRQAELKKYMEQQDRVRNGNVVPPTVNSNQEESMQAAVNATQEMLRRHHLGDGGSSPLQQTTNGVGMDPFLNTGQQQSELHNRQESADSGLGMGSNFNLGSIPEDMSMETDLDTTLTDSTPTAISSNIGTRNGSGAPTTNSGGGNPATGGQNMDASDQLIPNLNSEIPNLGDDDGMLVQWL